ncbi:MAG: hypothetical protein KDC95_20980 [Planctomycetes bacterium]|nr:hypothetical protein [Planctomycetota bacterium]MCA8972274.1 hypothetical protein [Planctomycetota bacterium]
MHRLLRLGFISLLASLSANSQVTMSASSAVDWSVTATAGLQYDSKTLLRASSIPPSRYLYAQAASNGRRADARAVATAGTQSFRIDAAASASAALVGSATAGVVAHTALRLASPTPTPGFLEVRTSGTSYGGALARIVIRIGTQTPFSWSSGSVARTQRVPVIVDASGTMVVYLAITSDATATFAMAAQQSSIVADVRFVAEKCVAMPYETSCQAAEASFVQTRTLEIRGTNSVPNGVGFSMVGFRESRTTIQYPGCYVLLDIQAIFAPYTMDANGNFAHRIPLPPANLRFRIQDAHLEASLRDVRTSTAFEVACIP